ncbi:MAG: transporter substrate-binding domain-containing protein [Eubacterium sp.]|nr:transporter substrate-binding domain-containing protein [Eubacterium sp.]
MHVVVAGTPTYPPYTYQDEDGNETGFDIEVLKAIDEIAPEIEVEAQFYQWDALMPALDAGRIDIACNQLSKTPEREDMYIFEQTPLDMNGSSIITTSDHSDWNSWEDLKGATVELITGSSQATMAENYLQENPGAFETIYSENSLAQVLEDLVNGRADATFEDASVARTKAKDAGFADQIYASDKIMNADPAYYLFAKTDKGQKLADIVDKYLPQLYYDGTLSKLAEQFIGSDAIIKALPESGYYTESTLEEYQAAHGN